MSRLLLLLVSFMYSFKKMRLPLGLLIVSYMSGIVETVDTETYKKVGAEAVLSPGSVSGTITSITWKHGTDIAVEWYGQELYAYRDFKDRCEVDTTTGALTISNLRLKDSGSYTAEVNNRIMKTTEIRVISAVPKPTISTHWNPEGTQCTLTCNANIPKTAESVTYSWMIGDVVKPSASKQLNITKNDTEWVGKLISCQLENPVSIERSDDIMSPFTNGISVGGIIGAVVAALIVLVALIALGLLVDYLIWRNRITDSKKAGCGQYLAWLKTRSCLNHGTTEGTREETEPLDPTQNGGAPDLSVQETSLSTVVPNTVVPNTATFSVDNETQDQNLGDPDARNETSDTLSGVPDTPVQDLTPVELPETTTEKPMVDSEDKETSDPKKDNCSETKVPKTTSEVQEEVERDQTLPGSADTSSKSESAVKQEEEAT